MASIFSSLHFPTSQPLLFVYILGGGRGGRILGVENLVAVLLPPTLHAFFPFFFFIEDPAEKKFTIVNFGLQGMKSCCENCTSLQILALTMAFV